MNIEAREKRYVGEGYMMILPRRQFLRLTDLFSIDSSWKLRRSAQGLLRIQKAQPTA
jgi:hypothetical protein